jgi:hypothetical protein
MYSELEKAGYLITTKAAVSLGFRESFARSGSGYNSVITAFKSAGVDYVIKIAGKRKHYLWSASSLEEHKLDDHIAKALATDIAEDEDYDSTKEVEELRSCIIKQAEQLELAEKRFRNEIGVLHKAMAEMSKRLTVLSSSSDDRWAKTKIVWQSAQTAEEKIDRLIKELGGLPPNNPPA